MHRNREYKDRLFKLIFSNKKNALELYNAVNGTNYSNEDDIEINTLDDVIYMNMKNDISFILDGRMNLYEQQSTYNPNMPVRCLLYLSKLYTKYIYAERINVHSYKKQILPAPKIVVFYNGSADRKEKEVMKLTDSFNFPEESCVELTLDMININYRKHAAILKYCKALEEYSIFVNEVRDYMSFDGCNIHVAVDNAVESCIEKGILKELLLQHKSEVIDMVITEFNEQETLDAMFREGQADGRADGIAEGRAEGRAEGAIEGRLNSIKLMLNKLSPQEIIDMGFSPDDVKAAQN